MDEARGVLPTFDTDDRLVLCKAAPCICNTYEIRLTLYFAVKTNRAFELVVPRESRIDVDLDAYLAKWGGAIRREDITDYTVSLTAAGPDGAELETWVLGDQTQWNSLLQSLESSWLTERLHIGASFRGQNLDVLAREMAMTTLSGTNLDGEPLQRAIVDLIAKARQANGCLFLQ
jgi:hypothetical protein